MNGCTLIFLFLSVFPLWSNEKIINKDDVESVFSLTKLEWNAQAEQMDLPKGWRRQIKPMETGNGLIAFDNSTGYGLSVQPIFDNNIDRAVMLTVGSYYPLGSLPKAEKRFDVLRRVEKAAQSDLGPEFKLHAVYTRLRSYEGIELVIIPDSN